MIYCPLHECSIHFICIDSLNVESYSVIFAITIVIIFTYLADVSTQTLEQDTNRSTVSTQTLEQDTNRSTVSTQTLEQDTNRSTAVVEDLGIDSAFTRMTSKIESILQLQKFPELRRACVQRIRSLGSNLPQSLVPKIQHTTTLDELLDVLAPSPYWNFFDIRLLETLVSASGSPEAEEWMESFKATFYAKKVTEVIPYVSIKPFKESIDIVEKFDKDPKDLTILELLEHKYKLEYEVLDIDEGELVLSCIKTGCVELTWQIPQELIYRAYTSMKRKHDKLSSLAVESLVCEEADEYVGLPILWHGQEVGEVGPIEPLPEHVRQEPYSLPQGFHWVTLSSIDVEEVVKFIKKYRGGIKNMSKEYVICNVNYFITYPNARSEWQFGIKATDGKLVGVVLAISKHIHIEKETKIFIMASITIHKRYHNKRMIYMLTKELVRRANLFKINQLILLKETLFKPVTTIILWIYMFNKPTSSQLPSSPRTPGWRRMTSEDVPSALALINKWSSQFEIRQVLNSGIEVSHKFLNKDVYTYVVEDTSKNITDLISYSLPYIQQTCASITTVVSTQSPVEQLIIDALVCARENGATTMLIRQCNIESDILASLSFLPFEYQTYHFYNYRYHEISQVKFWI